MWLRTSGLLLASLVCSALASAQGLLDVSMLGAGRLETQLAERRVELEAERGEKALLEQQLMALPELERSLDDALSREVRALYRLRRGGLLPMAEGLASLMGHASRVAHFERMARRTLARLSESKASGTQLAGDLAALDAKIIAGEQALIELEHTQAALTREAVASQAIEASRASAAPVPLTSQESYGLSIVGEPVAGLKLGRFGVQRGKLALPVSGAASIETADTLQGEPKALTFRTKPAGSVRAVADGRVALSEARDGHGILVIVEHGEKYRTLYGGLASSDVQPGDSISKSARIGTAGSQPIYFELRQGSRSQDARSWLGL